MITARVIADSISPTERRCTTVATRYPLVIHAEVLRHRGPPGRPVSHSVRSARAVPLAAQIQAVSRDPFVPREFSGARKGMQGGEPLDGFADISARSTWQRAAHSAANAAAELMDADVHQQHAARLLAPFAWVDDLITAETWANFLHLRDSEFAQPEIRELAQAIRAALEGSRPRLVAYGDWHLPYAAGSDVGLDQGERLDLSAARCARVSYHGHDGRPRAIAEDLALARRLSEDGHWSPFEHQRWVTEDGGWETYRASFEGESGEQWPEPSHLEPISPRELVGAAS